jgi:hypothetical protein
LQAAAPPAFLRVVSRAAIALVLVAGEYRRTVLDEHLSVAVKTSAAEFGVNESRISTPVPIWPSFDSSGVLSRSGLMWFLYVEQSQYVDVDNLEVLDDELRSCGFPAAAILRIGHVTSGLRSVAGHG